MTQSFKSRFLRALFTGRFICPREVVEYPVEDAGGGGDRGPWEVEVEEGDVGVGTGGVDDRVLVSLSWVWSSCISVSILSNVDCSLDFT